MKKPESGVTPTWLGKFPDEKWLKVFPCLCEYLADETWEDGTGRELSTLTIKSQEGHVLAVLNDVAMRRSLYVAGESVEQAVKALERSLGSPGADWRPWGGARKKK